MPRGIGAPGHQPAAAFVRLSVDTVHNSGGSVGVLSAVRNGRYVCEAMRILVVDDESSVRSLLRRILELDGHDVVEAHDGAMALEQVKACGAELVMTDMMMPVMRGNELIAKLRADPVTASIPIVVVSSEAGVESLPADGAVAKPFSIEAVLDTVRALTGSAG